MGALEPDDPARAVLAEEAAALPAVAFFTPAPRRYPSGYATRRGFIEELACSTSNFVAHADKLDAAPIARGHGPHRCRSARARPRGR